MRNVNTEIKEQRIVGGLERGGWNRMKEINWKLIEKAEREEWKENKELEMKRTRKKTRRKETNNEWKKGGKTSI